MNALKIILGLLIIPFFLCLFAAQTTFSQTEKLGIVRYASPKGMTKTLKENVVAFSELNQTTGTYCIITLYGATPGTGNPTTDFKREWNNLIVKTMKAEANPKTDEQKADGWTVISGGGEVESEVGKAVGFLTVISGFGKTVSIVAVFNDQAYVKQVDSFIGGIDLDKTGAPANKTAASPSVTFDTDGNIIIPIVTRALTVADLAGEWGDNPGRISTQYIYRDTGSHAGSDSLHFTNKMSITKTGGYKNDFFEVRNGKKLSDATTGTISIAGRVITIKHQNTTRLVVIGWLELPDMTILTVSSPYYEGQAIPEQLFTGTDPRFYSTKWVRMK